MLIRTTQIRSRSFQKNNAKKQKTNELIKVNDRENHLIFPYLKNQKPGNRAQVINDLH